MQVGDTRVEALYRLLTLEIQGTIDLADGDKLSSLRAQVAEEYPKYYRAQTDLLLTDDLIDRIEKDVGKKLQPGLKINLDQYDDEMPSKNGDLEVESIKKLENYNGKTARCTYLDPLFAAVYTIKVHRDYVMKKYSNETYLRERDAYLFHALPVAIIAELYSEMYEYTNDHIVRALETPVVQKFRKINHYDYESLWLDTYAFALTTEGFNSKDVKEYIEIAQVLAA